MWLSSVAPPPAGDSSRQATQWEFSELKEVVVRGGARHQVHQFIVGDVVRSSQLLGQLVDSCECGEGGWGVCECGEGGRGVCEWRTVC